MNCHYYVEWYLALFSFNWASILLSSSSNNGLHTAKVSGILCCVPGMEPWLQTHKRGQRSFSLSTVGEFGKIFSKINNYVIETIASLTIFIEIKEYFITRNIKNVSLKGHLGNHVLSYCLCDFHESVSVIQRKYLPRMIMTLGKPLKLLLFIRNYAAFIKNHRRTLKSKI